MLAYLPGRGAGDERALARGNCSGLVRCGNRPRDLAGPPAGAIPRRAREKQDQRAAGAARARGLPPRAHPGGAARPGPGLALAAYRGQIVLISFWASWCRPCDYELPLLNQFYLASREQGVQVIAISTDSDRAAAQKYADDRKYAMPMVWDPGGRVADLYQADVLPTLIIIDPAGRVREVGHGVRGDLDSWLDSQVRLLTAQKPAEKKAS